MRFLLLARLKSQNGTLTVVTKLSKWMSRNGHDVFFLKLDSSQQYLRGVSQYASVLALKDIAQLRTIDCCFSFTSEALYLASLMKRVMRLKMKNIPVVLHPREFVHKNAIGIRSYQEHVAQKMFKRGRNFIFMNNACRKSHEVYFGGAINGCVVPLPLVEPGLIRDTAAFQNLIVSIGRLVDFKDYHGSVFDFISRMKSRGREYIYEIYGGGPLQGSLVKRVSELGLESNVRVLGEIPYDKFASVAARALVFVGMGAAAIEAASLGIPTIIAIESSTTGDSAGFFGTFEGYEVGEASGYPSTPIIDCLEAIAAATPDEYERLCKLAMEGAQRFSLDVVGRKYLQAADAMESVWVSVDPISLARYAIDRVVLKYFRHWKQAHK